jgi:hypothetical protein
MVTRLPLTLRKPGGHIQSLYKPPPGGKITSTVTRIKREKREVKILTF